MPRASAEFRDLRAPLLLVFLLAFLADALATRLGWQLPGLRRAAVRANAAPFTRSKRRPATTPDPAKPAPASAPTRPAPAPSPSPVADEAEARTYRVRQAKVGRPDDKTP